MSTKDGEKKKFHVNRKKYGMTWSNPTDEVQWDNPISGTDEVVRHLEAVGGKCMYYVAEEHHKDGTRHYHAWCNYAVAFESKDCRCFDLAGVHPKIENPGKGWLHYVQKAEEGKILVTNVPKGTFHEASGKRTWEEAAELLWREEPKFMLQYANTAELNFKRRKCAGEKGIMYYGPWPKVLYDWDPKHTLVLRGPAGVGKTQVARYLARHMSNGGDYCYVKGPVDKLKKIYHGQDFIVFDDISPFEKWTVNDWCSLFDTENGGSVNLRTAPADLAPGARILIDNGDIVWPDDNKLRRRLHIFNVKGILTN